MLLQVGRDQRGDKTGCQGIEAFFTSQPPFLEREAEETETMNAVPVRGWELQK